MILVASCALCNEGVPMVNRKQLSFIYEKQVGHTPCTRLASGTKLPMSVEQGIYYLSSCSTEWQTHPASAEA